MRSVRTVVELRELLRPERSAGRRIGLVPTMGYFHDGHLSLMRRARSDCDVVVVSLFVNPAQFAAGEDLDAYPRDERRDAELAEAEGVDILFAPAVEEVYPGWPAQPQVTVEPGPLASVLEGEVRPGHFRGVLTVVAKLFGLVRPDLAVFGEKDYQQLALIRRMVADLCLGVEIVGAATVREIQHMLGLGEARGPAEWRPSVVKTVATKPHGVDELIEAIDKHQDWLRRGDELRQRRVTRAAHEVESIAIASMRARMGEAQPGEASLGELAADVVDGRVVPYAAADRLLESVAES